MAKTARYIATRPPTAPKIKPTTTIGRGNGTGAGNLPVTPIRPQPTGHASSPKLRGKARSKGT